MNDVTLLGRVGKDLELKETKTGKHVVNFGLVTSERWTDKSGTPQETPEWHRIVFWDKMAVVASNGLKKGSQVLVKGRIKYREYSDDQGQKKSVCEIIGSKIEFVGSKQKAEGIKTNKDFTTDDIPF